MIKADLKPEAGCLFLCLFDFIRSYPLYPCSKNAFALCAE
jgi:hypothetical protein